MKGVRCRQTVLHMRNIAPGLIRPIDYTFPTRQEYVFWSDTSARPAFWPEDVPYGNIKRSNKESLCRIIHAYPNANDNGHHMDPLRQLHDE